MTPQNDKLKSIIEEFREKFRYMSDGRGSFRDKTASDDLERFIWDKLTEYGASERAAGEEEGAVASRILFDRLQEWNKEWQAEDPERRSLVWMDAKKLIEWKIERQYEAGKHYYEQFTPQERYKELYKEAHAVGMIKRPPQKPKGRNTKRKK